MFGGTDEHIRSTRPNRASGLQRHLRSGVRGDDVDAGCWGDCLLLYGAGVARSYNQQFFHNPHGSGYDYYINHGDVAMNPTTQSNRFLLIALLFLGAHMYAMNAEANDTYVYTGAWSKHLFSKQDYNETHNFLAVEHKGVMAGYFKNSYSEDSAVVGFRMTEQWGDFEGGIMFAATHGYRDCVQGYADASKRVCPAIVPSIAYTKYRVQPVALLLGNALAFSVRWEL